MKIVSENDDVRIFIHRSGFQTNVTVKRATENKTWFSKKEQKNLSFDDEKKETKYCKYLPVQIHYGDIQSGL